nr:hypothetical protein [Candidatus Sigynarchaeota archaeon]
MVEIRPDTSPTFLKWKNQFKKDFSRHNFMIYLDCLSEKIKIEDWDASEGIINQFVLKCGAHPIAHWRLIQIETAEAILTRILWKDLAYSQERMNFSTAKRLTVDFFNNFVPPMLYLTNGEKSAQGYTWDPITEATFDGGVIVFDGQKVGMLWVADED